MSKGTALGCFLLRFGMYLFGSNGARVPLLGFGPLFFIGVAVDERSGGDNPQKAGQQQHKQ